MWPWSIYSRLVGTLVDPLIGGLRKTNARATHVLGALTMAHFFSTTQVVPASCPGAGRGVPCLCAAGHCMDCTPGAGGSTPRWQGASAKQQQQQCAQLLADGAQRRQQAVFSIWDRQGPNSRRPVHNHPLEGFGWLFGWLLKSKRGTLAGAQQGMRERHLKTIQLGVCFSSWVHSISHSLLIAPTREP